MAQKNVKITFEVDGIQQTVNSVDELNEALGDTAKAAKDAGDEQGFFSKKSKELKEGLNGIKATLKEVGSGIKNGFKNLGQFAKGFKTAGGAAKNFGRIAKGAIAATGIGLLVVAVVSLIDYFTNLEGGAKALKKVMAGLGAIVTNISKAFSLVVRGKFSEAFDVLKDSVVEATEAVDNQFEAESKLSELRQKNIIENAKLNQSIEKNKKVLEDSTLSAEKRLEALDKVNAATRALQQNTIDETKLALDQAKAELVNINNFEERRQKQEEIAQLQADLIDQTTTLQNVEYDAARVAREIRAAEEEEKRKAAEEEEARKVKAAEEDAKRAEEKEAQRQKDLEEQKAASEKAIQIAEAEAAEKKALEDAVAQSKIDVANSALSTITAIAGEQSALGKAAAISQATINTYQAATNALANTPAPPPFPQIAAAATVAQGLLQVKNILKTTTPGGETAGATSAPTAPSFSTQGVNVSDELFNQGSNVVTPSGGSSGSPVRAYVVASEVTSSQEANKKLDDLARL